MHFQHQKLAALQGKSPMGGKNHHPSPNMGSATAGMHGEREGVLGMSPRGSWHCCVFFFSFPEVSPAIGSIVGLKMEP